MHPVITAWLALVERLDTMPPMPDWYSSDMVRERYSTWLEESIVLSDWFNTLRRLNC